MNHRLVFSAALVLVCVTVVFAQRQKIKNTLAERQLHGHIAQRTVKRYYLHRKTRGGDLPYYETTYTYNEDGNNVESRYQSFFNREMARAVVKPEYTGGSYAGYTKYDSLGKVEETAKVNWLNDSTYVTFTNGKNINGTDTVWLHSDYNISRLVSVYEKAGEKLKDELYYEAGWPVKTITEHRETGEQSISTYHNIVLEKDVLYGNPVKMYIVVDNRDTTLVTTSYRYFGKE